MVVFVLFVLCCVVVCCVVLVCFARFVLDVGLCVVCELVFVLFLADVVLVCTVLCCVVVLLCWRLFYNVLFV